MNELQKVFEYQEKPVRTRVDENGEIWFVASDTCEILDLGDTSKAVSRLDDDEKGTNIIRTPGGIQEVLYVNESGLYHLIFTSRKPEAKLFRRWVFHEVLPSIRKTGKYELPQNEQIKLLTGQVEQLQEMVNIFSDQIKLGFPDHKLDYLTEREACKVFNRPNGFFRSELVYEGYLKSEWGVLRITEKGKKVGEEFFVSGRRKNPFIFRWKREVYEKIIKKWDEFMKSPWGG